MFLSSQFSHKERVGEARTLPKTQEVLKMSPSKKAHSHLKNPPPEEASQNNLLLMRLLTKKIKHFPGSARFTNTGNHAQLQSSLGWAQAIMQAGQGARHGDGAVVAARGRGIYARPRLQLQRHLAHPACSTSPCRAQQHHGCLSLHSKAEQGTATPFLVAFFLLPSYSCPTCCASAGNNQASG